MCLLVCPMAKAETIGDDLDPGFDYGQTDGWAGGIVVLLEENFSETVRVTEWGYRGALGGNDDRWATPLIVTDVGNDEFVIKGIGSPLQWPGPGEIVTGPFGLVDGSDVVDPSADEYVAAWHGNLEIGTNTGAIDWQGGGGEYAHDIGTNPNNPDTQVEDIVVGGSVFNGNGVASTSRRQYAVNFTGSPGLGNVLQAGDADMDLDFDQLDLVKVQIAAKYLTGRSATWGEGDWNGAPGGSPGNPPAGDNLFNQSDIIAALGANKYLMGPYAALANANGVRGDGQTSIVYNAGTGEVAVDAPAGTQLTSINIDSAGRIFTGSPAANLGGSFDNDSDGNIFKATFGSSFGSLSFGNVAQAGLARDFVANDLTVVGSLAGGGGLGNVDLIYIPEPSTILLFGLGVLCLWGARRRRH
jgi:hypothetical protein